jgi:hypothetical protein
MRALMTLVLENWAREERGEPVGGIPLHAVFVGPPGKLAVGEWGVGEYGRTIYHLQQ